MQALAFHATGSEWWVGCDRPALLPHAEDRVRAAEQTLSRFVPSSRLCELNRERTATDPMLAEVVSAALHMRELTGGAFDPRLGARLCALGYDDSFERMGRQRARAAGPYVPDRLQVSVRGQTVELHGEGELDLGGIAKGFIVDHVLDFLAADGCKKAVVDGGGDIRVLGGPWPIALESGHVVSLTDGAIATSSVRKRRWPCTAGGDLHHVLDPRTGEPTRTKVEVATVRAKQARVADALATAIVVDTQYVSGLLPRLGAAAALCDTSGTWWMTPSWELRA